MKPLNDKLSEALDIEPLVINQTEVVATEIVTTNNVVEDDAEFARRNLKSLIEKGNTAVDGILNVASATDHPRAFEVYGTLLKNVVDANKELLNIQKQMREMDEEKKKQSGTNIDKAIFIGSTAELNRLIKGKE